jgi:hypothetical protein
MITTTTAPILLIILADCIGILSSLLGLTLSIEIEKKIHGHFRDSLHENQMIQQTDLTDIFLFITYIVQY